MLEESRSLPLITSQKSCLLQAVFSLNVYCKNIRAVLLNNSQQKSKEVSLMYNFNPYFFPTLHIKVTNEHDSSSFISTELNALTRQLLLQMHECVTSTDLYKSITEGPENTNWFPK